MRRILVVCCLLLSILLPAVAKTRPRVKSHKAQPKVQQPEPAPVTPQPAPPPPTPEQGPSSPAEVKFQAGQLTIVARNSTMSDVLAAVKQKTGAAVEMPAVSSERVAGRFGPGTPRDVMAQLLNGSHYDYVLLGSPADPGALKKVVLIARANGPDQLPPPSAQNIQQNTNLQAVPDVETDQTAEENNGEVSPDMQQQEEEPQPEPPGQPGQPNAPAIKTPEQLLRELQQQQQQQNVPPGAPGQPPQ